MEFAYMDWVMALIGGLLIGLAVTIMLIFNGRVTGISGITYGAIYQSGPERLWRAFFLMGLLAGGFLLKMFLPESLASPLDTPFVKVAAAGFLVGFGTLLGNGCTSGHGVCGISRFSLRSITATLVFIAFGVLTVSLTNHLLGGL